MRTRIFILSAGLATGAILSGCSLELHDSPVAPGQAKACGMYFNQHPCIGLSVSTLRPHVLIGDTVRFITDSDSGYASPVTWSVVGGAELVPESERDAAGPSSGLAARSILVRAIAVGSATVTARYDDRHAGSGTLTIAAPSAITSNSR